MVAAGCQTTPEKADGLKLELRTKKPAALPTMNERDGLLSNHNTTWTRRRE
jgi:hypothetical protein